MIVSPAPIPNQFRNSEGEVLKLSRFNIGGWDMTSDTFTTVDISPLTYDKIQGLLLTIQNDSENERYLGNYFDLGFDTVNFFIQTSGASTIVISIDTLFTQSQYDSDVVNRGWLDIWHKL